MLQERPAGSRSAVFGPHVEILDIEASSPDKGRKVLEINSESRGRSVALGEDGLGGGVFAEEALADRLLRGDDLVRDALELGKLADELEHERDVVYRGLADRDLSFAGHGAISSSRVRRS
jgi:hypothetical protein